MHSNTLGYLRPDINSKRLSAVACGSSLADAGAPFLSLQAP